LGIRIGFWCLGGVELGVAASGNMLYNNYNGGDDLVAISTAPHKQGITRSKSVKATDCTLHQNMCSIGAMFDSIYVTLILAVSDCLSPVFSFVLPCIPSLLAGPAEKIDGLFS
jgi:hypothetical protein